MDSARLTEHLPHITGLQCVICGAMYSLDDVMYTCPTCGPVGTLDVLYRGGAHRYEAETGLLTMWQQPDILPAVPPVGLQKLGGTTLLGPESLTKLAAEIGVAELYIKHDGLNMTGSLKDRASAMVVAHAVQNLGRQVIATASTGNAAAALAGVCASVPGAQGAQAVIFAPATAPEGKIAQMVVFGANVILVNADYDTAFDLCGAACDEFGWYNRSTGINPFTSEGKKTVALEIAMQLKYQLPDVIVVSVGDGSIIGGVHKGLVDMQRQGWIDKVPRLIGVQAAGSDALVYAWEKGLTATEMQDRPANTIADSISSRLPRDRAKALRAVRQTNGAFIRVTDEQILAAIPALARGSGVFAEPAAAATFAALKPALAAGMIHPHEQTLLLVTGTGLKDVRSAMVSVNSEKPPVVEPSLEAVRHQVKNWQIA
ncbi:MAG: threonine synthase [Anaerolineae bacterium]|nr:MAG: threonine synthase [Anaerolineae bacterium]